MFETSRVKRGEVRRLDATQRAWRAVRSAAERLSKLFVAMRLIADERRKFEEGGNTRNAKIQSEFPPPVYLARHPTARPLLQGLL